MEKQIKVTKSQKFNALMEVIPQTMVIAGVECDMREFLTHEIELLAKKSENKKPTKANATTMALEPIVLEVMSGLVKPMTVTEIQKCDSRLQSTDNNEPISNQRLSAIMKKLVDSNKIVKATEKGKSVFKIV